MPTAGPNFNPDESRLGDYAKHSGGCDDILAANNPDIRRFRDNGGKRAWGRLVGAVYRFVSKSTK